MWHALACWRRLIWACMRAQVVVLFVEQEESVRRQLNRAALAARHNTRVLDAGARAGLPPI